MRFVLEPVNERILSVDAQIGGVLQDERAGVGRGQRELLARAPHHGRRQGGEKRLEDPRRVGVCADEQDVRTRTLEYAPVFT